MTKKDYIRIAKALNRSKPYPESNAYEAERGIFETVIDQLCIELKEDNPNFNPERFRCAVYGLKGGK